MNNISLLLNKQILLALGTIVFIGAVLAAGTGAFFSSSATATANVFTAGTLTLKIAQDNAGTPGGGWLASQNSQWNFTAMTPGGTPSEDAVWLKNEGTVDGMTLGVALANVNENVGGLESQMRITKMTLDGVSLLSGGAGMTSSSYVVPTNCTVTLGGSDRLADAIFAASPNDVICTTGTDYSEVWESSATNNVGAGGQIIVNKPVTIVSVGGPSVSSITAGLQIDSDDVTIKGFTLRPNAFLGEVSAIYLNSLGADDVIIDSNVIAGTVNTGYVASERGIVIAIGATFNDVEITNNEIRNLATGIYSNPHTGVIDVMNNSIHDNLAGIGGFTGIDAQFNQFFDNGEAIGTDATYANGTITNNEFLNGDMINSYGGPVVVATNNWWDGLTANTSGSVTSAPVAGAPITGFVNGVDGSNGNGFADVQDLRLSPIVNAGVGLNAGQEKRFIMAVQLDGPTTGNAYQGASLTTDVVFTLNQI